MNKTSSNKKKLSANDGIKLLNTLKTRFEKNISRHKGLDWSKIQQKLESSSEKLWSLHEMEITGGEPDVVNYDKKKDEYIFIDCAPESPAGRRSICYDLEGLESRKEHRPKNNAVDMAAEMGITMLSEDEYRELQKLEKFDTKTSSWLRTPEDIRDLGGAIFGDYRFGRVFVYHNGAQSYYGSRAFRGLLRV